MSDLDRSLAEHYLANVTTDFRKLKTLGERALVQIPDERQLHALVDQDSNSIAILIRHLSGNMLSRWTDFLTSDGEKPDRDRDREFAVEVKMSREALMAAWERGWECLFQALSSLTPEDLQKKVYIRGEEHSVVQAINRQLWHYAYHLGQMVFLAKHLTGEKWQSLSIPRGESARYRP